MIFGQFVQQKRKCLKISQQALTDACGFANHSNISRLEAGQFEWKLREVVSVARLFGLEASDLLAEFENENHQN